MASNHLNIHVEYFSKSLTDTESHAKKSLTKQDLLLYSPSTVHTLCKEVAHSHSLPTEAFTVFHNGVKLDQTQRIIDRYTYHIYVEYSKGLGAVKPFLPSSATRTVHFDSDVYMDSSITIVDEPMKPLPLYFAFYQRGITHLLDAKHGAILTPTPGMRLGHSVVYVDWGTFQPVMASCPTVEPMTWMYDRLQRDYGISVTASIFGIHTAPLSQLQLYQSILQQWLEQRETKKAGGVEDVEDVEDVEGVEEEEEEEEEDGEEEEEEDMTDVLDDIDYYDDTEMWR